MVGIDRYRTWPTLDNAVSDAQGALAVFGQLGFAPLAPPLLNEAATGDAIRRLVTDDLATLGGNDSLVLFFAGHGHTQTRTLPSGSLQTGYIIPADGDRPEGRTASWLRLDTWLSDVSRIPARHILVILDACHSGIALGSLIKWRGGASARPAAAFDELRRRQSRRVITSALGDQRAMDSGPIQGHSLFTGCLIEGLTGGLARDGRLEATGSEIGLYVQQRVTSYTGSKQTPDFGTLELDDRGEIVLPIAADARLPQHAANSPISQQQAPDFDTIQPDHRSGLVGPTATGAYPPYLPTVSPPPMAMPTAPTVAGIVPAPPPWHIPFAPHTAVPFASEAWRKVLKGWSRYLQALGVIVALVFFAPAGIGLSWALKLWSKRTRIIASAASTIFFIFVVVSGIDDKRKAREAATQAATTAKPVSLADAKPASSPTAANASPPTDAAPAQAPTTGNTDSSTDANPAQPRDAAAAASHTDATPTLAFSGPSCADVIPKLGGNHPGLLPFGVPASAASRPLYRPHKLHSTVPIVVDGEVFFLDNLITDGKLVVSREVGNELQAVRTLQFPSLEETPLSSDQFEVTVGDKSIGIIAINNYREVSFSVIDKKTWITRRMAPLFKEFSESYTFLYPHVAAGRGSFGVAVRGNQQWGPKHWTWAWQVLREDGRPQGKPKYFDSSTAIEPRVAWNGSNFVVLAGRVNVSRPVSLGVYVMPAKEEDAAPYVPWLEPRGLPREQEDLDIGGALLWQDGQLHVAMRSYQSTGTQTDIAAQLVHADLAGHVRAEHCFEIDSTDL